MALCYFCTAMGRRTQPDAYYQKAKDEGYAARSVYKLKEIDRRYGLLRRGAKVLDLGCHPGSWLQWTSRKVGPGGLVVGVDIQPLKVELAQNARFIQADLFELEAERLREYAPAYDLALSDAAPRTTGVAHADTAKSHAMAEKALELAGELLVPGGSVVVKIYFGPGADDLIRRVKMEYKLGKAHKPSASKSQSKETYLVGRGFKG